MSLLALLPGAARAEFVSELRWTSDSFLSPAYESSPQSTYQFLGANFKSGPKDNFAADINGAYAIGAPLLSYMNVRELSYHLQVNDQQTLTFGRKLERWSELDRRWNFGLVEPVFEWNPLSPQSQGLTGVFWQAKGEGYRLLLFGSPLYIPNQGPSFEINSEGEFDRGNPWFRRPPSSIKVLSQVSKIEYVFEKPSETSVVFQTSYGAELNLGDTGPWRVRGSALYKPMNKLALGYAGLLDIPRDRGVIELQPEVVFHSVRSIDAAYIGHSVAAGLSLIDDQPDQGHFADKWTAPQFSRATLFSPWIDVRLAKGYKMTLMGLSIAGGEVTETGPDADASRAPITSRYPYSQAGQIGLEVDQRLFRSRRLITNTSYTQSVQNEFRIFRVQARLELSGLWSLQSELQMVDAEDLTKENRNDIAEFNNNDRILVGVGYVF